MARHYRVKCSYDKAWSGRMLVLLSDETDFEECDHYPVEEMPTYPGIYLLEILHRDGHLMGWEMNNIEEFYRFGWGDYEGPKALLIDLVYAPEGVRLKELFRRVNEHRTKTALSTGVGAA